MTTDGGKIDELTKLCIHKINFNQVKKARRYYAPQGDSNTL